MVDRIIFFNLADDSKHGLVHSSAQSLREKFHPKTCGQKISQAIFGGTVIETIDLFDLLDLRRAATDSTVNFVDRLAAGFSYTTECAAIKERCRTAKKLMLGAHGRYNDTEKVFKSGIFSKSSGQSSDYEEMASVMADFLDDNTNYKLALIVCYGALSAKYDQDHDKDLPEDQVKSSLAYKFFASLCSKTRANVIMTARTGKVGFGTNGKTQVEPQAGIDALVELEKIKQELDYPKLQQEYKNKSEYAKSNNTLANFMQRSIGVIEMNEPAQDGEEVFSKLAQIRKVELKGEYVLPKEKYGKFVYSRNQDGMIEVYRKYPVEPDGLQKGQGGKTKVKSRLL